MTDAIRGEIYSGDALAAHSGRRRPSEIVSEYDVKIAAIPAAIEAFKSAQAKIVAAHSVGGAWPGGSVDTGRIGEKDMALAILRSAWRHTYEEYNLKYLASAEDKKRIEQMFQAPPPFDLDNIREQFGDYVADPRGSMLRALAEAFSRLDPAFKSHEKMKIGVKGLPKRVIISNCGGCGSWGHSYLEAMLNALAAYQGKPLISHHEINALLKDENALISDWEKERDSSEKEVTKFPARGIRLRRYQNGNGHLYFEPDTLRDVNMALAEYYGDVLPDCPEERPTKQRASTAVSKDLQYYPTPVTVVDRVLHDMYGLKGARVLEPSCGCGRFMDAIRAKGGVAYGIEYDAARAAECKAKGHTVFVANFLETVPTGDFDRVVMNPPFYGRHYVKHVRHALKFMKPGGTLTAILPITARYDHGELDDLRPRWSDLPLGSFRESGTNINTTIATITKESK